MTLFDWDQVVVDLAAVRAENEVNVTLRRENTTLDPQPVRIARIASFAHLSSGDMTQESRGRVVVLGSPNLDIQPDDRFNDGEGGLYRVVLVRPNRRGAVIAEAEVVE